MKLELRKDQIPSHLLKYFRPVGYKSKDLVNIPSLVSEALRADGWYLRSDIIWAKPNPMPESVTDRPTSSYEHVFLLTKSARYFYDADAVRENYMESSIARQKYSYNAGSKLVNSNRLSVGYDDTEYEWGGNPAGRNLRNVWTIATAPYSGAHFATFPPKLVDPMVKAGTSERGACPHCGAPWKRVTEKGTPILNAWSANGAGQYDNDIGGMRRTSIAEGSTLKHIVPVTTIGWEPTCDCPEHEPIPCIVLDPFAGSGTTGVVCQQLGREFVGMDLSMEYLQLARERTGARAWDEWHNGKQAAAALNGLPLFAERDA